MPMYQLRKRPPVEVRQLTKDKLVEIEQWIGAHIYMFRDKDPVVAIEMNDTTFYATLGDFVVNSKGSFEIEPFREFHKKYELVA